MGIMSMVVDACHYRVHFFQAAASDGSIIDDYLDRDTGEVEKECTYRRWSLIPMAKSPGTTQSWW